MLTRTELKNYMDDSKGYHTEYKHTEIEKIAYPFKDIETNEVLFSSGFVMKLEHEDSLKNHTVILTYNKNGFAFWCGDGFLDTGSKITKKEATSRIETALTEVVNNKSEAEEQMINAFGSFSKSTGCRFWASWKGSGKVCSHVNHLLQYVKDNNIEDELISSYANYTDKTKGKKSMKTTNEIEKLLKYAFKKHCLITGPKGFGKTYGAYETIDTLKVAKNSIFEVGGFEGLESIDLLGQNIPFVKEVTKSKQTITKLQANSTSFGKTAETEHIQDLVWLDGALTAAFRNSSKGKKTVLLIDELFRIPSRELSILVAALTPDNKGFFTLRTRKIMGLDKDGNGIEEVIKCKKENLWIVATTNVGSEYDTEDIDAALEDRFMIIHKSAERNSIKEIVENSVRARKFKIGIVAKLMEFYDKMESYKNKGELTKLINTRHLTETIEFSDKEDDIKNVLNDMILKWTDRDTYGEPDSAQVSLIEKTIEKTFS